MKKSKTQEKIDKKQEHRRLGQKQGDLLLKAGHPNFSRSRIKDKKSLLWTKIEPFELRNLRNIEPFELRKFCSTVFLRI